MGSSQKFSTNDSTINTKGFNCSGLYCQKPGIHLLRLIYIGKSGFFCDEHADMLKQYGFVEPETQLQGCDKDDETK